MSQPLSRRMLLLLLLSLLLSLLLLRRAVLQVEHRNKACGQRLHALTQSATKRFFVFSNEHHKCAAHSPIAAGSMAVQQCGCAEAGMAGLLLLCLALLLQI